MSINGRRCMKSLSVLRVYMSPICSLCLYSAASCHDNNYMTNLVAEKGSLRVCLLAAHELDRGL